MRVYLDHNSTTPLRGEARARWLEVSDALPGNPSSPHASGRRARAIVDDARARVAAALGVLEDEIFFTSGATEANNLALFGAVEAAGPRAGLVTTTVEHSSVLGPAQALAEGGRRITLVPVDGAGLPAPEGLAAAARELEEGVVSVAAANNEVGAMPDLCAISAALAQARRTRLVFHTDAAQALGRIPVNLRRWGVGLASFSAHKLGGPPGVGILWRKSGVALAEMYKNRPGVFAQVDKLTRLPIMPSGGSLLIKRDGRVVGAVGISAAPNGDDDECAQAGIDALG